MSIANPTPEALLSDTPNGRLLHDIYTRNPLIEQFVTHCGLPEDTSESLIFATFEKKWQIGIQNYEVAGRYRDLQREALETLATERDLTMARVLETLVNQMFEIPRISKRI